MTPTDTPILIDTNIWIGHFRTKNEDVSFLLEAGRVVMTPSSLPNSLSVACVIA